MGNSWKNFDLTFGTLRAFRQRDSSLSLSLITQSGLNSRITIIIRTLGSLQNRVALMHWPKFSEILSAGETQFIGTAGDVCFLENLNHNSGLHFHLLSQVSELTSYEFVSSTGCTSTAPTDPLNVPVAQWDGASGMPPSSAWRRQCLIKTWPITLIYCLEAGTSKLHIVSKYVVEQLPGTIRYLPAIKHKFIANEPTKRSTLSLWDLCKQRFHTLGVFRNFYRSFCGVSWSAGEVVDSSFNSSSSLSVGVTSSVCL